MYIQLYILKCLDLTRKEEKDEENEREEEEEEEEEEKEKERGQKSQHIPTNLYLKFQLKTPSGYGETEFTRFG